MKINRGKILGLVAVFALVFMISASNAFAAKGVMKGSEFTTINVTNMQNEGFQLGHQGYPMVINFWATWCPPCRGEMPELQKFGERNPGVELYLVSLQESPETIRGFLKSNGLNLKPVIDPTGAAAELYRVTAIPTTIVVNEDGIIIYRKVGAVTAEELEKVLGR